MRRPLMCVGIFLLAILVGFLAGFYLLDGPALIQDYCQEVKSC